MEAVTAQTYRDYVDVAKSSPRRDDRRRLLRPPRRGAGVAEGWDRDDGRWTANIFSYPPIGSPDGGAHATASDLLAFSTRSAATGSCRRISPSPSSPRRSSSDEQTWYGFGLEFRGSTYYKEGHNAGVSGILSHHGATEIDAVVLSNTEGGAWPVVAELNRLFEHA